MHMEGMRPRRQPLESWQQAQGYLLARSDGDASVPCENETDFPAHTIGARQVNWNHDVLRLPLSDRARDLVVLRYGRSCRHARQSDRGAGPQQTRMLSQPILIGVIDDLPFR